MGGLTVLGDAVSVMHLLGAVQAESDGEALRREKAAPVLVEEGPVGLDAVGDAPVRGLVLALQRHDLAEVVQAQDGRLPAVPGEPDHCLRGGVDVLDDVLLQDVVGHAERLALWV